MVLHFDVKNGLEKNQSNNPIQAAGCHMHAGSPHWLPIGQPDYPAGYRCATCTPPPSRAFVQRWAADDHATTDHAEALTLVDRLPAPPPSPSPIPPPIAGPTHAPPHRPSPPCLISYERPMCPVCACRWLVEVDSHVGMTVRCWTCKRIISDAELSDQLSKPKPTHKTLRKQG